MAATTPAPVYGDVTALPSGGKLLATFPDLLMIPELIFGGLVWILVASSKVPLPLWQGWVMFVSVSLFLFTFILMILYCARVHGGKSVWSSIDAFYHFVAALFYLSASVLEAAFTASYGISILGRSDAIYKLNIAATVFVYLATLSYVIHAVFSLLRWKKS
ncbi:myelin and lymphocyte protein [Bombina bombina]|uniref:myelin and lymphocyte protein n=1 Tax=Bombina bombina TaxID=8345 RepID=UPI00235AD023|nr:myelin and lymphocyte protein [Bombina bombina]